MHKAESEVCSCSLPLRPLCPEDRRKGKQAGCCFTQPRGSPAQTCTGRKSRPCAAAPLEGGSQAGGRIKAEPQLQWRAASSGVLPAHLRRSDGRDDVLVVPEDGHEGARGVDLVAHQLVQHGDEGRELVLVQAVLLAGSLGPEDGWGEEVRVEGEGRGET